MEDYCIFKVRELTQEEITEFWLMDERYLRENEEGSGYVFLTSDESFKSNLDEYTKMIVLSQEKINIDKIQADCAIGCRYVGSYDRKDGKGKTFDFVNKHGCKISIELLYQTIEEKYTREDTQAIYYGLYMEPVMKLRKETARRLADKNNFIDAFGGIRAGYYPILPSDYGILPNLNDLELSDDEALFLHTFSIF